MDIHQARERELFNWASFDIASGFTVAFDQDHGSAAVALNRVLGTTDPMSILNGNLEANGQVYVINANGILFGPDAQIDVHSLVASSLDVWDTQEFLAGNLTDAIRKVDSTGQPVPEAALVTDGPAGDVELAAGADIETREGGRVMLVAPAVRNAGRISAPGGQAILAGGYNRVFITASDDPNLRGLVVEVDTGGKVENLGEIIAERGNVSLLGLAVNQQGLVRATSAVNFNGSIRIAARHKANQGAVQNQGGAVNINSNALATAPDEEDPLQEYGVTLGSNSATEVLPELDDTEAVIDATEHRPSRIELVGKRVTLMSGSHINAPNADVTIRAPSGPIPGTVDLESGATIDVAGVDSTTLPMSRNVGRLELRGTELADVPLQRTGVLRGAEVTFDLRKLTFAENSPDTVEDDKYLLPVGDATAAVNAIRRGIGERSAAGGHIGIQADTVNLAAGSLIDFSGGKVTYEGGFVPATYVISEGRLFEITEADPTLVYDAVLPSIDVVHRRWGVTETFNVFGPTFGAGNLEPGYVQGYDAGSLVIAATEIVLDGELRGDAVRGHYQRQVPSQLLSGRPRFPTEVPLGGLLQLGSFDLQRQIPVGPSSLVVGRGATSETGLAITESLLAAGGITRLTAFTSGTIELRDLDLAAGGELALTGGDKVDVTGMTRAPSGRITLANVALPGTTPDLVLHAGAGFDTQGAWVNDTPALDPTEDLQPLFVDGGEVTLDADGAVELQPGSLIDVGGGAQLAADGELLAGTPGDIILASHRDRADAGSPIILGGEVRGYGIESGGTLSLTAIGFNVAPGGAAAAAGGAVRLDPAFFGSGGFANYELIAEGGLSNAQSKLIDVVAGADLLIQPRALQLHSGYSMHVSGTDIDAIAGTVLLPASERSPTSLTLEATRFLFPAGDLPLGINVGSGARISVEAGGSIAMSAQDRIFVNGWLSAPGGTITLSLEDAGDDTGFRQQGIWIGPEARLDAKGVARTFADQEGLITGEVLRGGEVNLNVERGYAVLAPGSIVDVSGTSGLLQRFAQVAGATARIVDLPVVTGAGTIRLRASEGILPYGDLLAAAGGAGAAGGLLSLSLDLVDRAGNDFLLGTPAEQFPETARVIAVGARPVFEDFAVLLDFDGSEFRQALRTPPFDDLGHIDPSLGLNGVGWIDPAQVTAGGFDAVQLRARQNGTALRADASSRFLELPAEVRFVGDVSLSVDRSVVIDAPVLSSNGAGSSIRAPYVSLGSSNADFRVSSDEERNLFAPTGGTGRLRVEADLIDLVGFMSLRGFGRGGAADENGSAAVVLNSRGDIRLRGVTAPVLSNDPEKELPEIQGAFEVATDLDLIASQVYPTTLSEFGIAVRATNATLNVRSNGGAGRAPLSAGAIMTLSAERIVQAGVLRAPLGTIRLNGALTDGGQGPLQILDDADNSGAAGVSAAVVSAQALMPSDYRLTYLGESRYELIRMSDGLTRALDIGDQAMFASGQIDGFRLFIAHGQSASPGDSFLLRTDTDALLGSVTLAARSETSASGAELPVPFGELLLENNWIFQINGVTRTLDEPRILSSRPTPEELEQRPFNDPDRPWTKGIEINGKDVGIETGSIIDLAGRGDLIAAEFRPGPNGSQDILRAGDEFAFALVPALGAEFAPVDPLLGYDGPGASALATEALDPTRERVNPTLGSDLAPELPAVPLAELQMHVSIGPGSAIPAGEYVVLPRGYAVLPGAFLATPVAESVDFQNTDAFVGADGVPVVSATFRLAGGGAQQARPIALAIESREQVFERAEYKLVGANEFFAERAERRDQIAPQLPLDGGSLAVSATETLRLQGRLAANHSGRSSQVDIAAERLAIVNEPGIAAAGTVELRASDLNGFGAESLLVGGTRRADESGTVLDPRAQDVSVESDVVLEVPEILLGATTRVTVKSGATLRGVGSVASAAALTFTEDEDGTALPHALVRVSGAEQVDLVGESAPGGTVDVQAGASLFAEGSITLDGSTDVLIGGSLATDAGAISLKTARISIGAAPEGTPGLVLPDLGSLNALDLVLVSAATIDLYGDVAMQATPLGRLLLDADALRGFGAGTSLNADTITLRNSGNLGAIADGTGTGSLMLSAADIVLGEGSYSISGFDSTVFTAAEVRADGGSQVDVKSALTLRTDRLSAGRNAALDLAGTGDVVVEPLTGTTTPYAPDGLSRTAAGGALGGRLTLSGANVLYAGHIVAPSGTVLLRALWPMGTVMIGDGAVIDVAGTPQRFDDLKFGTAGGRVELHAGAGGVAVAASARIDVSGVAVPLADGRLLGEDAGTVVINAPEAAFGGLPPNAVLGGMWLPGADGRLFLANPVSSDAALATEFDGGRFVMDVLGLTSPLDDLTGALRGAGFGAEQRLRIRDGDLAIGNAVRAARFELTADRGAIDVAGTIDASGPRAGSIALYAGGDLSVAGRLDARSTLPNEGGGEIDLGSRDGRIDLLSGAQLNVTGGGGDTGLVRLHAARTADDLGVLVGPLHADVRGAQRIEVIANKTYQDVNRIVAGNANAGGELGIDFIRDDLTQFMGNADAIRSSLDADSRYADVLDLLPGVEIRSPVVGDTSLTLTIPWDFAADGDQDGQLDWRFGAAPGMLTLRAFGDLVVNADLSDGIGRRSNLLGLINFAFEPGQFGSVDTLLTAESWNYRLVAGADLTSESEALPQIASADPFAVRAGATADLKLADGVRVRTGTGTIELAAAGDLDYGDPGSAIYTVGIHAGFGTIAFDPIEYEAFAEFLGDFLAFQTLFGFNYAPVLTDEAGILTAPYFFDTYLPGAAFGDGGGDIDIRVGGDVNAPRADQPGATQLLADWLVVLGGRTDDQQLRRGGNPFATLPTLWTIRPGEFRQNLGTLGGGDIRIEAGGDLNRLSVMLPTTGQPVGDGYTYLPSARQFNAVGTNEVRVLGGGNLDISAGGSINGGTLFVGRGAGRVRAGGSFAAPAGSRLDPIVTLGEATLEVTAGGNLTLETAANFSMLRRPPLKSPDNGALLSTDTRSYYFTYGSGSALRLTSLSGDVRLQNANEATDPIFATLPGNAALTSAEQIAVAVYPGTFSARALGGDVLVEGSFQLYPDPVGTLQLLADGTISDLGFDRGTDEVAIVQSDADPARLPSIANPATGSPGIDVAFIPAKQRPTNDAQRAWHAALPIHLGDDEPSRIVARAGSIGQIQAESRGLRVFMAEQTLMHAGVDIRNVDLEIQNVEADDYSVVGAGRDILFSPRRGLAGNFSPGITLEDQDQGILFSGPGHGTVVAGRDIDLGTSGGIFSVGDLRNFALADTGADITVFAGEGGETDLVAFYDTYIRLLPADDAVAVTYLRALLMDAGGNPTDADLRAMLAGLRAYRAALVAAGVDPTLARGEISFSDAVANLLVESFFAELEASGTRATSPAGNSDYSRGFAAIDTLFPADTTGALSLLLSRIHTEDGGDINVLVPGGSANAGTASTRALTKSEDQLGIVAQQAGDVRGFVRDNFFVNASRVFALQGGDILIWASEGDIDAGRGAKTALAAPPPQVVFDAVSGSFVTVFPPEVAGSGIRNFAPPGVKPGDVFLFAPQGVVSAGDAGIASAGSITIGAVEVVGADNISAAGIATGVPAAPVSIAAGLTGVSAVASSASRAAQESTSENFQENQDALAESFAENAVSIIQVEVLGFGE
jgi:filamentous hemagglutinin family protein